MIQAKAILPKAFKIEVFRQELTPVIRDAIDESKRLYEKTEATWREKATWGTRIYQNPAAIIGKVWTENDIVRFLEKGTKVRYATMSPDFQPKTKVRWIGSGLGEGGLMYVSRKHPRPGIQARHWTDEIKKVIQPRLRKNAIAALARTAVKSGHAI